MHLRMYINWFDHPVYDQQQQRKQSYYYSAEFECVRNCPPYTSLYRIYYIIQYPLPCKSILSLKNWYLKFKIFGKTVYTQIRWKMGCKGSESNKLALLALDAECIGF